MRYAVWFVRFLFAAWMIPAGINHFVQIFPQPMGSQPLSMELIRALIDSHLFDLVKAVELVAGVAVLVGWYTPLALLVCLPVSFGVFWWDAPLEGWGSRAALFGYATLLSNVLLCLAWLRSYLPMFTLRVDAGAQRQLLLAGRLLFGAWMLLNGANYLFLSLWDIPSGGSAEAAQLMTSLVNSRLLDVVMVLQLVAGALLLAGVLLPVALYALMPLSSCALFWALVLDQQALNIVLALAAFTLNGLLMLACLPHYRTVLQRSVLAFGERSGPAGSFDELFVDPRGTTAAPAYIPALLVTVAAIAFFGHMVGGRTGYFCMLMLLYPAFVLLTRRLRDMGRSPWLTLLPLLPALLTFAVVLDYVSPGATLAAGLPWASGALAVAFALWGAVGKRRH